MNTAPIPHIDLEMFVRLVGEARSTLHARERERLAALLRKIVEERAPRASPLSSPLIDGVAARLEQEGCCVIERLLTPEQAASVAAHFSARGCFNAHVPNRSDGVARLPGAGAEAYHYGSYAMRDIVEAPHLIELANDPQVLAIAGRYLGCTPTLYSLNAWWSFPAASRAPLSQSFHRDVDDFRFCTLFIYLTDVDEDGGPHLFVRRSHRADAMRRETAEDPEPLMSGELYGRDAEIRRLFGHLIETVTGRAGTGLIADTYGIHMGVPPRKPRLMFWARYGMSAAIGPASEPVEARLIASRLPWNELAAYVNRLLILE